MEQPHEARQEQGSGRRWVQSICKGMSSSVGCSGRLPEVQCNQSLDLTCRPKGPGFHSGGNGEPSKDFLHEDLRSDLNSRMFTPVATGTEDGLQGGQGQAGILVRK